MSRYSPSSHPIVTVGDPVLSTPCSPVAVFDKALLYLAEDMRASMIAAEGVGLAANQIGVGKQIFVYRCPTDKGIQEGTIVNPQLILPSENERTLVDDMEGCLSIPNQHGLTPRYRTVTVTGVNLRGEPLPPITASGFLARCFQHEVDHLNGMLYVDRLTRSARRDILAAYRYSETEKNEETP